MRTLDSHGMLACGLIHYRLPYSVKSMTNSLKFVLVIKTFSSI